MGVTAISFLNKDDKIVFCHPYRVIQRYKVNEKSQLEYTLEISKHKTLVYTFDSDEASQIVTSIDKSSLRLEKVIASTSAPKSPRGGNSGAKPTGAPLLDAEGEEAAAGAAAPVVAPRTKIADVQGMRFNVRLKRDGNEQRVVAIVNEEGIIVIDPSIDKGGTSQIACQKFPWSSIQGTQVAEKSLTITTQEGSTVMYTPDAHSFLED